MLEQFSGTVFQVPRGNTSGLNVQNFMQLMGAGDETEFTPIQAPNAALQTGVDATGEYYDSLERANRFGMQQAAKGIDVFKPNSRNPQSVAAASEFQRLMRNVNQQGNGLRAGQEMAKLYAQQRLRPNVVGGPLVNEGPGQFSDATTASDLDRLTNIKPLVDAVDSSVKDANRLSNKPYTTFAERDDANHQLGEKRKDLSGLKPLLIEAGYPEDIVDTIVQAGVNRINDAIGSEDALELKKTKLKQQEAFNRSRINKNNAQAAKARRTSGKKTDNQILLRKETIERIQNGDLDAVSGLVNGKIGDKSITKVDFIAGGNTQRPTGESFENGDPIFEDEANARPVNTLVVTLVKGDNEETIEIPMGVDETGQDDGRFFELNNILNTAPGQEKFSVEDLSKDVSDLTEKEKSKEGLKPREESFEMKGVGKVTLTQLKAKYTDEQIEILKQKGIIK